MRAFLIEAAVFEALPMFLTLIIGIGAGVAIERLCSCRRSEPHASQHTPHVPAELDSRLSDRAREIETLRTRITEMEQQGKTQALSDPLTGAANHMLLTERIDHAITRGQRHNTRIGLLMLDLKNFSTLNERFDQPTVDHLLIMLARKLREAVRAEDTVSHLHGDVFAIALEGVFERDDIDRARESVERVFAEPFALNDHRIKLEAELSSALYPADGSDAEALLRAAEHGISAARMRRNHASAT